MSEFSFFTLKNALLKTRSTPTETKILGTEVYLRRLTATELIDRKDTLIEVQTSGNTCMASELGIQIVIDSLVHPNGSPIKAKDKSTAKELPATHDSVAFLDAIDEVERHAIGKLETVEKS